MVDDEIYDDGADSNVPIVAGKLKTTLDFKFYPYKYKSRHNTYII